MMYREISLFESAVNEGDIGLVGMDGSGNDWEFSQNIGSTAVNELLLENETSEEA